MKPLGLFAAFLFVFFPPHSSVACLWDRDTIHEEAEGKMDVITVISGRFDRHPPKYYEMRLERVTKELATDPSRLDLYDDAGVACDRLHRGDEAIAWMEKKRGQLDELPESESRATHLYRYHANLGTFLAHRWLRDGAPDGRISELEQARDEIARAIEINPDAHFGREKYQLMALEWLIDLKKNGASENLDIEENNPRSFLPISTRESIAWIKVDLKERDIEDAVEGISGLITLGNAWESPDVFLSLQFALQLVGDSHLAELARLRREELENLGHRSLYPRPQDFPFPDVPSLEDSKPSKKYFRVLRSESNRWQHARAEYQRLEFSKGKHPDTDSDFWEGFRYRGTVPTPPKRLIPTKWEPMMLLLGYWIVGIGLIYLIVRFLRFGAGRRY